MCPIDLVNLWNSKFFVVENALRPTVLSAAPPRPLLIDACYGLGEKKKRRSEGGSRGLLIPGISHVLTCPPEYCRGKKSWGSSTGDLGS